MAVRSGKTKAQWVAMEVARAVNAGKPVALETVDFSDPDQPKTCLEVDFPILPVNEIATIEGNAMKPVYHLGKWWAWRRSSVFRSMLLAASMRAPDDPADAAKLPSGRRTTATTRKSDYSRTSRLPAFSWAMARPW